MSKPAPHRPYVAPPAARPPQALGPVPCACKCGEMVYRDDHSQRALYVNDGHKRKAEERRKLVRYFRDAGIKFGENEDDAELSEIFRRGRIEGRRRARAKKPVPCPPILG